MCVCECVCVCVCVCAGRTSHDFVPLPNTTQSHVFTYFVGRFQMIKGHMSEVGC